jgi:hypothetical protein
LPHRHGWLELLCELATTVDRLVLLEMTFLDTPREVAAGRRGTEPTSELNFAISSSFDQGEEVKLLQVEVVFREVEESPSERRTINGE